MYFISKISSSHKQGLMRRCYRHVRYENLHGHAYFSALERYSEAGCQCKWTIEGWDDSACFGCLLGVCWCCWMLAEE